MKTNRLFWGAWLIILGVLFLAGNLGLIQMDIWSLFWPMIIILLGFWFLWGSLMGPGEVPSKEVSLPLQGAERAALTIKHGAGRLQLASGAAPGMLVSGTCGGGVETRAVLSGSQLDLEIKPGLSQFKDLFSPWNWLNERGLGWDLHLSPDLPIDLRLESGAAESRINLRDLWVTDFVLKTGASSTDLTLPAGAGLTSARLEAGAAAVNITIPDGVAARITTESGLAAVDIDQHRFPRDGNRYQSPDYSSAENRVDLRVETGLGSVQIR